VRVRDADLQGGEFVTIGGTQIHVERVDGAQPAPLGERQSFGRVVGGSVAMRRMYPLCERIAASSVPVIIEGETGTGKEAMAEALHEQGPRARGPFVVFDCTAVPPNLLEAEFFGHERGAFTGATAARSGVLEQARDGTLLIDEIGELELPLQAKLLRAIERTETRRVGGDRWIQVDVRIIAATRRNLDREVQAGRFRDDLYHRLAVVRIEMPPLRDRAGDVGLLARRFWQQLGGDPAALPRDLVRRWEDYEWPGNVRELRNVVARRLALGDLESQAATAAGEAGGAIEPTGTDDIVERVLAAGLPFPQARDMVHDQFVKRFVAHVLAKHGGNVVKAAEASGIGRRYLEMLRARSAG
jgi:DNA-binding NtrC family response regulator